MKLIADRAEARINHLKDVVKAIITVANHLMAEQEAALIAGNYRRYARMKRLGAGLFQTVDDLTPELLKEGEYLAYIVAAWKACFPKRAPTNPESKPNG